MKMFKKVMAVALAGVLALSVLTGCGGKDGLSVSTKNIADALTDFSGGSETYTASDELDKKVAQFAQTAETAAAQKDYSKSTVSDIRRDVMSDNAMAKSLLNGFGAAFTTEPAVIDDASKPAYTVYITDVLQDVNNSDNMSAYYAMKLQRDAAPLVGSNVVDKDGQTVNGYYDTGDKVFVGMTECKMGGKSVLMVVLQQTVVTYEEND